MFEGNVSILNVCNFNSVEILETHSYRLLTEFKSNFSFQNNPWTKSIDLKLGHENIHIFQNVYVCSEYYKCFLTMLLGIKSSWICLFCLSNENNQSKITHCVREKKFESLYLDC